MKSMDLIYIAHTNAWIHTCTLTQHVAELTYEPVIYIFLPVWQHKFAWHYSISTKQNLLALSPSNGVVLYGLLILLRGTKTNNIKKFEINNQIVHWGDGVL